MARKHRKGSNLSIFKGKQARLNRVILLILDSKRPLIKYDIFLEVRRTKGFKHEDSKTVYRRAEALHQGGWIAEKGKRPQKVQGESTLYKITPKGEAALKLDQKSIEKFLETATEEQLNKFLDLF